MSRSGHFLIGAGRPVPQVATAAARYREQQGLRAPAQRDFSHIAVDPAVSQHIASMYEAAPEFAEHALPSFRAMREDTNRQFDFMTHRRGLGLDVSVQHTDPYGASATQDDPHGHGAMVKDISEGRLKVLSSSSTGGHPFFTDEENEKFRAVHDVFGHAGTGRDFSRHGEEAAWMHHSSMYSPAARPAMTTETRGQNSALNFGSSPGTFAPQKVALLGPTAQLIGRRSLHRVLGRQWQTPVT